MIREHAAFCAFFACRFTRRHASRENNELGELADATGLLERDAALHLLFKKEGKRASERIP